MTDRRETSAGGVVCRRVGERFDVVLATQRDRLSGRQTRRLPKGKPARGETLEQAALREVSEEAGVVAKVIEPLGAVDYVYREGGLRIAKQVHFFLMQWVSGEPTPADGEMEQVAWCALDEAVRLASFETERTALARARARLAGECA